MHSEGRFGYIPRTCSPYEILGVSYRNDLTDEEVASAYRRAALMTHPDKRNGSQEKFEQVKAASEMIKTSKLREAFHTYGGRQAPGPGDMMGNLMDKILPLIFGAIGGFVLTIYSTIMCISSNGNGESESDTSNFMSWAGVVSTCIISLGSGTAYANKAPFAEVLATGVIGLVTGGMVGSLLRMVLFLSKLFLR